MDPRKVGPKGPLGSGVLEIIEIGRRSIRWNGRDKIEARQGRKPLCLIFQ